MAKKIPYKPVETIELEFADGVTKEILFSAKSVAIVEEEFEGLFNLVRGMANNFYSTASKIIYAGMKVVDESITLEEVESLIIQLPFNILQELVKDFMNNITNSTNKEYDKEVQKIAQNFMKEILQAK